MIYFKENMFYLRKKKTMTIKELSIDIGFSTSQWNNYELGLSFPKFLDLIKISKYFEISESDLIHVDLKLNELISKKEEEDYENIVMLQNKLIKIQDEKINKLENDITLLKRKNKS